MLGGNQEPLLDVKEGVTALLPQTETKSYGKPLSHLLRKGDGGRNLVTVLTTGVSGNILSGDRLSKLPKRLGSPSGLATSKVHEARAARHHEEDEAGDRDDDDHHLQHPPVQGGEGGGGLGQPFTLGDRRQERSYAPTTIANQNSQSRSLLLDSNVPRNRNKR